jgi:ATP-binding cassette subfamily B protein
VILELRPEWRVAWTLVLANGVLAAAQFAEPWVFGLIVDALTATRPLDRPLTFAVLWPLVGA